MVISVQGGTGAHEGNYFAGANPGSVRFAGVDITSELQLRNLHATHAAACCSSCERRLLPGETLHIFEARSLCTLCAGALDEQPVRRERIHATPVRLAVVPRAA
jgi:hypothetical protein